MRAGGAQFSGRSCRCQNTVVVERSYCVWRGIQRRLTPVQFRQQMQVSGSVNAREQAEKAEPITVTWTLKFF